MPLQTHDEVREEFNKLCNEKYFFTHGISEWWLSKLAERETALVEMMIEEVIHKVPQPEDWLDWTNEERRSYLKGIRAVKNLIHSHLQDTHNK